MSKALQVTLTPRQAEYVRHLVSTGDIDAALVQAGYGEGGQKTHARHHPAVRAAIDAAMRGMITSELGPLAVNYLARLVRNAPKSDKLALDASKFLAGLAGYVAPKAKDNKDLGAKSDHELTSDELTQRIQELERIKSDKARPIIDSAPGCAPVITQDIDLLD